MRPSPALRLSSIQLTLFTRANCGLCDVAKARIGEFMSSSSSNANKTKQPAPRVVNYTEIDIMDPAQTKWREVYEFDVPVLHVDYAQTPTLDAAKKLMHRFTAQEVENAVDEVEQRGSSS
ncbi:uncharacterized protein Z520_09834 [Fonsecaea multimorphosa CBS 102226]|uniref:Glutaredoxin-like protein n=1 Tax=Fonsecaea multimorphosa CBS 102226 TaxID=1442371 RepID=A0A0D2KCN3_9EURO|nr:uncharacterized protein Z520_09834 [Fonsecaea multimorphosa CBS 102226]KIX94448.1 hypothetical protein Z520_09834 [Fonsecaea multimorphosa CBS 102226]OAL20029.1 hypothetical protein AYO22_09179 [Fonsecaea multimorphosa]